MLLNVSLTALMTDHTFICTTAPSTNFQIPGYFEIWSVLLKHWCRTERRPILLVTLEPSCYSSHWVKQMPNYTLACTTVTNHFSIPSAGWLSQTCTTGSSSLFLYHPSFPIYWLHVDLYYWKRSCTIFSSLVASVVDPHYSFNPKFDVKILVVI